MNGIEFLDEDAEFFPNGSLHDATLAQNAIIQSIPCLRDRNVVFFASGQLKLCWLSSTTILDGIPCLGGSIVYLHETGHLLNASLASEHQIDKVLYSSGSRLTFNEDGQLLEYSQELDTDQLIEGFSCSSQFVVWRYVDSRPSLIVLSSSHTIDGQEYPRGAEMFSNNDGDVINWNLIDLDSGQCYKQRVFGVFEIHWQ